jgi:hypothetical protein
MSEEEMLLVAGEILSRNRLIGKKLISLSLYEDLAKLHIAITYQNGWGDEKIMYFHIGDTKRLFSHPLQILPRERGVSCDHVNVARLEGTSFPRLIGWIGMRVRKKLSGISHEVMALDFFTLLAQKYPFIGEPRKATQKEDRVEGKDIILPIRRIGDQDFTELSIDIKTDPLYQRHTKERNKEEGRFVSTLCFRTWQQLKNNKDRIVGSLVFSVQKGEPFNLNLVPITKKKWGHKKDHNKA